jgi:hypothetical protein
MRGSPTRFPTCPRPRPSDSTRHPNDQTAESEPSGFAAVSTCKARSDSRRSHPRVCAAKRAVRRVGAAHGPRTGCSLGSRSLSTGGSGTGGIRTATPRSQTPSRKAPGLRHEGTDRTEALSERTIRYTTHDRSSIRSPINHVAEPITRFAFTTLQLHTHLQQVAGCRHVDIGGCDKS